MYLVTDRDWEGAPHFLGAALLLTAAALLLFVSLGGGPGDSSTTTRGSDLSATAAPPLTVRREAAGQAFEAAGAAFLVDASPAAGWTEAARRGAVEPGQRRFVVAVEVVNRARERFNPGLLSYLVRGPRGALFAPARAGVVGPAGLGQASGLPVGARAEERLVFSLPADLHHPVLAIQPSPTQTLEVRVPLASPQ